MVRPIGITKTKRMFGYKYTPEEYEEMTKALEKFKAENNCTTSKALYILITQKNKYKTKRMFGYKYTPEEYEEMTKALEKFKAENNCTTSKALYILITQKNK